MDTESTVDQVEAPESPMSANEPPAKQPRATNPRTKASAAEAPPEPKKEPIGLTFTGGEDRYIEGQPRRDLAVREVLDREPALVIHMTAGATPVYEWTKAGKDAWEAARG